ncbi:7682_t:CDS:2 [Ambispora leptoticha]|uniref:7682_t:CDS:1 n=1 Tax=Ambispora leptoticha TaxID=144679 RepID=A0A9N8ZZ31_9GLOM|nr:7682_t:CDS:2 [Ambispora leptoticha]
MENGINSMVNKKSYDPKQKYSTSSVKSKTQESLHIPTTNSTSKRDSVQTTATAKTYPSVDFWGDVAAEDSDSSLPELKKKFSRHIRFSEEVRSPEQLRKLARLSNSASLRSSISPIATRQKYQSPPQSIRGSSDIKRDGSDDANSFDEKKNVEVELEQTSNDGSSDLEKQRRQYSSVASDNGNIINTELGQNASKRLSAAISISSSKKGKGEKKNSSIAIVRAVVPTTDNSSLPCLTFRFWLLGTIFTVLGAAVSQYSWFRSNALPYSIPFVQLATYPLGNFLAAVLPKHYFNFLGWKWTLNPGPFNIKEHVLISVAVSTGGIVAYATYVLSIQALFYNQDIGLVGSLIFLWSTQLIGYGIAGALRKFLVYPASMIWPLNLVQVALYNTLHENTGLASGSRLRFFVIIFGLTFIWELLPILFFPTLSSVAILCLINNKNRILTSLGSSLGGGFGFLNFSLDWSVIGQFGPLYVPWWTTANYYFGIISMAWFIGPILYYGNVWNAQTYHQPITPGIFREDGSPYNPQAIITGGRFDEEKYKSYGQMYLSPYFAFCYAISFASLTALITHVYIYYGKEIWNRLKNSRVEEDDIHHKMMNVYPEVPGWCFAVLTISMTVVAVIFVQVYPTLLPWWGVLLAICIAVVMVLPIGIIQAISNIQIGLNVVTELVCGYILPGRPIANVVFKTYGYMTVTQCLVMVRDLKLGHYMKIPPRAMFIAQLYGTAIGVIVNYFVLHAIINLKRPYLDGTQPDPTGQWSGRSPQIFYSASIIWGLIGPSRFFGPGSLYYGCLLGFVVGFVLPIPFYLLHRKYPNTGFNLINLPIIASGASFIPQVPTNVIMSGLIASTLSQFYAARYHTNWFRKYNYVLAASLDSATTICAMFVFAAVTGFPRKQFLVWWGNSDVDVEHCTPGS